MKSNKSDLKADFIGYHIFIKIFDGDIDKWKKHLREKGSMNQVTEDYQFILRLEEELKKDPDLINRIRQMVSESDPKSKGVNESVEDKINKEMTAGIKKSLKSAKISHITKAIDTWVKSNMKDVTFIGSFVTHSLEGDVTDDLMIAYGPKDTLKIHLEGLEEELSKEKDDFVSW